MNGELISLGVATDIDSKVARECLLSFADFRHGVEILGTTQTGKTNTVMKIGSQAIDLGLSFTEFDIEGSTTDYLLRKAVQRYSIEEFAERVVVVDFTGDYRLPLNLLAPDPDFSQATIIEELVGVLAGTWTHSDFDVGIRMVGQLRSAAHLLAEHGLSLSHFPCLIHDRDFSAVLAARCDNPHARYWHEHYRSLPEFTFRSWSEAPANKLAPLILSPFIAPSLDAATCINVATWMDEQKQVLIRMDEDHLGPLVGTIGALLMTKYDRDSRRRDEHPSPHILIADEVQEFATPALSRILARRQKRGLGVLLCHQLAGTGQLSEDLFEAILGLTRTRICFPLGNRDQARRMAREMFPLTGDRRTKPVGNADQGYWGISEEIEHFSRQIQEADLGQAVIQRVHEGRTSWLATPLRDELSLVSKTQVQEYIAASQERNLASKQDIKREQQRQHEYVLGLQDDVRKVAHARALAAAQRRKQGKKT